MQARTVLAVVRVSLCPCARLNECVVVRVDSEVERQARAMALFVQVCHSQEIQLREFGKKERRTLWPSGDRSGKTHNEISKSMNFSLTPDL